MTDTDRLAALVHEQLDHDVTPAAILAVVISALDLRHVHFPGRGADRPMHLSDAAHCAATVDLEAMSHDLMYLDCPSCGTPVSSPFRSGTPRGAETPTS
jgi:hypothetical protein